MEKDPTLMSGEIAHEKHELSKDKKKKKSRVAHYISSKLSKFLSTDSDKDNIEQTDEPQSFKDKFLELFSFNNKESSSHQEEIAQEDQKEGKIKEYLRKIIDPFINNERSETEKEERLEVSSEDPGAEAFREAPEVNISESFGQQSSYESLSKVTATESNKSSDTSPSYQSPSNPKEKKHEHREFEKYRKKTNEKLNKTSEEIADLAQENLQLKKDVDRFENNLASLQRDPAHPTAREIDIRKINTKIQTEPPQKEANPIIAEPRSSHAERLANPSSANLTQENATQTQDMKEVKPHTYTPETVKLEQAPAQTKAQEIIQDPIPATIEAEKTQEPLSTTIEILTSRVKNVVSSMQSSGVKVAGLSSAHQPSQPTNTTYMKTKHKNVQDSSKEALFGIVLLMCLIVVTLVILAYAYFS